jgi:hydroxymethylpyrimidine kinase/phosphomethylpyrimidine kinase
MRKPRPVPIALTIAGSDSGGGAGIQADLKTFAALGVHGASAITCITAQNPRAVSGIEACSPEMVRKQLETVFAELRPKAVKSGMLFSAAIIRVVVDFFQQRNRPPLVVDPVMISTSGAQLLKPEAVKILTSRLLPLAALVTPNVHEAEELVGTRIRTLDDLQAAARAIHERFGCPALVKGGHLKPGREAVDILFDGQREMVLRARFIKGIKTHGTGCTYSAAITAFLACGLPLARAVQQAKQFVTVAISKHYRLGRHPALNTFG